MLNRVDKERSLEEVCRARESLKDTVSQSLKGIGWRDRKFFQSRRSHVKIFKTKNCFVSWPIESSSNHVNRVIMLRTKSCFQRAY